MKRQFDWLLLGVWAGIIAALLAFWAGVAVGVVVIVEWLA